MSNPSDLDFSDHAESLFNVLALLDAAAGRIDAITPDVNTDKSGCESMHNT